MKKEEIEPQMSGENCTDEDLPPEVNVEFAANYLGTTHRTITNYLKSRQLKGQKVGKSWFICTKSLQSMRPKDKTRRQSELPPIENDLSRNQFDRIKRREKYKKEWELIKTPKRNLRSLRSFARLNDSLALLEKFRSDFTDEEFSSTREELMQIADDLGAGYFQYGRAKLQLYSRARLKAGKLVARGVLSELPPGLMMELYQLAESISSLCRSVEKKMMVGKMSGHSANKPNQKSESHEAAKV